MEDGDLGLHRIRMPAAVVSKGLAALRTTCQQNTVISDMCCASCKADHLSRGRRAVVSVWFSALLIPNIGPSTKWVIEELHLSGDELRPKTDCVGPCRLPIAFRALYGQVSCFLGRFSVGDWADPSDLYLCSCHRSCTPAKTSVGYPCAVNVKAIKEARDPH